jgi:hypothetical protein
MPMVGKKKFSYTKSGMKKAKAFAKKKGKKVNMKKGKY